MRESKRQQEHSRIKKDRNIQKHPGYLLLVRWRCSTDNLSYLKNLKQCWWIQRPAQFFHKPGDANVCIKSGNNLICSNCVVSKSNNLHKPALSILLPLIKITWTRLSMTWLCCIYILENLHTSYIYIKYSLIWFHLKWKLIRPADDEEGLWNNALPESSCQYCSWQATGHVVHHLAQCRESVCWEEGVCWGRSGSSELPAARGANV